jgi:hypothetical protein
MMLAVGRYRFYPSKRFLTKCQHGPKTWPWWRWISISIHQHMPHFSERKQNGWNIWIYTRWGALCEEFTILRKGQS